MLLGWWADAGFAPLQNGCCCCVEAARPGTAAPGMWVGMLLLANAAMLWLGRRPLPRGGTHTPAMFTGGNVGMVAGMAAGGLCSAQLGVASVAQAVAAGFAGMTVGMVAGMLVGTWIAEELFAAVGHLRVFTRTAGRSSTPTARTRSR
jgi:hypothetical protein